MKRFVKRFVLLALVVSALCGCADMPFHDEDPGGTLGRTLASGDAHAPIHANDIAHAV